MRLVADGVEVLLDVEVELERIGGQRLFDLRLAVEGLVGVTRHVQRLGGELRWSPSALDREQDFVKEVEDGGVQILFVGLLLLFQLVALWVAFGDTTVGFLRGVELARSVFDAPHGGLVAGEDTEVVLLAQALEEFLHLLGRNFGIRTDDEQDASAAHAVSNVFDAGQREHVVIGQSCGPA